MPVYVSTSCPTGTAGTCWITTNCTTATAPTATTTNTVYWVMDGTGNGVGAGTASATATGIPPWPTWWVQEMDELAALTAPRRRQSDAARRRAEYEEYAAAEQRRALRQAERRQAQQLQQDVSAIERAHALLLEHLTPKQRQTFADNEWFIVEGGKSKTQYRIRGKGSLVANIDVMEQEKVKHRLCGHCDPRAMPLADHLLAQKLMLEFAEDDFLRIANRHAA